MLKLCHFSISFLRTDVHTVVVEVNSMGWELGRERSEVRCV